MEAERQDIELSQWFSSYGLITAERLFGKYHINLPQEMLLVALKNSFSFYHRLIQVPLKNVLNGIVLQQAEDYHIYVQKLFIDYLLSGDSAAPEESQGASTRESMEVERTMLLANAEAFHQVQLTQNSLIALSQNHFIILTTQWRASFEKAIQLLKATLSKAGFDVKPSVIRQAINHVLIQCNLESDDQTRVIDTLNDVTQCSFSLDIKEQLFINMADLITHSNQFETNSADYYNQTQEMSEKARSYRTIFYDAILRTSELIKYLPEYKINAPQDLINRELLHFDKTIGEK